MVTNLFFYLLKVDGFSLYNKYRNKELIGQSYLAFNRYGEIKLYENEV